MKIKVLKFGGTSLKNHDSRLQAIQLIRSSAKDAHVVVVVSAMGRYDDAYATDTLASLIKNFVTTKEKDRLLSIGEIISSIVLCDELIEQGLSATSLSIQKAGILTDNCYGRASVEYVKTDALYDALKQYQIVVVPGFQGISREKEVTTLGRGGSDYTAVILARALHLKEATIYSDVCGIYTGDPKVIDHVALLKEISYQQACEIAQYKSHVINEDAVRYAEKYHIKLILRSTFEPSKQTVIHDAAINQHCVCFALGYYEIRFDTLIHIDDLTLSSFSLDNDHYVFEKRLLNQVKTAYTILENYAMIHFVGYTESLLAHLQEITGGHFAHALNDHNTYFVPEKDAFKILNQWHDAIIMEGNNEIM